MAVEILHDVEKRSAVLTCGSTGAAFGPVFRAAEDFDAGEVAEAFLQWMLSGHRDPRTYDTAQLARFEQDFRGLVAAGKICECGHYGSEHAPDDAEDDDAPCTICRKPNRCFRFNALK
jgi:hypothetical protein